LALARVGSVLQAEESNVAEKAGQKKVRRIAAVLIILMGLGLIQDRVRLLLVGQDSLDWPSVTGVVTGAAASPLAGAQAGPGWRIRITYEYKVDGRSFSGERLRFSRRLGGRTQVQAKQALLSYVPGGPVNVHFDPADPARSVILPGPDLRAWFGLFVGLGMVAIAITFWTVPTRSQRQPRTARRHG
jgi:hypothetical protein